MCVEIERLRQVSGRLLAGEELDRDLADWLGTALQGFLNRRHRTVEQALGLRFAQGGVPWWREEAMRKRDAAIRELGERFFRRPLAVRASRADLDPRHALRGVGLAARPRRRRAAPPLPGNGEGMPVAGVRLGRRHAARRAPAAQHPRPLARIYHQDPAVIAPGGRDPAGESRKA